MLPPEHSDKRLTSREAIAYTAAVAAFGVIAADLQWLGWALMAIAVAMFLSARLPAPWGAIVALVVVFVALTLGVWRLGPDYLGSCRPGPLRGSPDLSGLGGDFPGSVSVESPLPGCVDREETVDIRLFGVPSDARIWLVNRTRGGYVPWPNCLQGKNDESAVSPRGDRRRARVQIGGDKAIRGQVFELLVLVTNEDGHDDLVDQTSGYSCKRGGAKWDAMGLEELPSSAEFKAGVRVTRHPEFIDTWSDVIRRGRLDFPE